MFPYVPQGRGVTAAGRCATQAILLAAAAALGREEQPEVYRHVHPHGRATAALARSFADAVYRGEQDPNHVCKHVTGLLECLPLAA